MSKVEENQAKGRKGLFCVESVKTVRYGSRLERKKIYNEGLGN